MFFHTLLLKGFFRALVRKDFLAHCFAKVLFVYPHAEVFTVSFFALSACTVRFLVGVISMPYFLRCSHVFFRRGFFPRSFWQEFLPLAFLAGSFERAVFPTSFLQALYRKGFFMCAFFPEIFSAQFSSGLFSVPFLARVFSVHSFSFPVLSLSREFLRVFSHGCFACAFSQGLFSLHFFARVFSGSFSAGCFFRADFQRSFLLYTCALSEVLFRSGFGSKFFCTVFRWSFPGVFSLVRFLHGVLRTSFFLCIFFQGFLPSRLRQELFVYRALFRREFFCTLLRKVFVRRLSQVLSFRAVFWQGLYPCAHSQKLCCVRFFARMSSACFSAGACSRGDFQSSFLCFFALFCREFFRTFLQVIFPFTPLQDFLCCLSPRYLQCALSQRLLSVRFFAGVSFPRISDWSFCPCSLPTSFFQALFRKDFFYAPFNRNFYLSVSPQVFFPCALLQLLFLYSPSQWFCPCATSWERFPCAFGRVLFLCVLSQWLFPYTLSQELNVRLFARAFLPCTFSHVLQEESLS